MDTPRPSPRTKWTRRVPHPVRHPLFDPAIQAHIGTNTTGVAKTSAADCRVRCKLGHAGYNGVEPCYECEPGGYSPEEAPGRPPFTGTRCRVASEYAPIWDDTGLSQPHVVNGTPPPPLFPFLVLSGHAAFLTPF